MVLVTNTSSSNTGDNGPLMGTGIQTCDDSNGRNNLHQHQTSETSDILVIPKLLENADDSKTRSQDVENGAVTSNMTATQQAVVLAYCLLIEKSSRHDELQRKLPLLFVHAFTISFLSYVYFHIRVLLTSSLREHVKDAKIEILSWKLCI